jgi:serine/threonine protein kinase
MGQIFRAKDLTMNRDVAIKVLHLHLAEEATAHRRFEREMQACLSLKHPNIVNVYDYGYTVEVTPYMVMEYLDGLTIEEYLLKKGHLTLLDFVQVFTQLCGAINQAHEKLIIHRDLKPSNIMLIAQPDGSLLAKLLDFGIAKGVGQTAVTNSNEVIGTVFYMSPEQCQNEVLDPRSDIYSLGCVMYEALSGLRPFHAGTPVATMLLHLNQEPASLREHDSSIPHSVEKLVFKALSKLPGERYQSASELLQALQLFHVEYSDLVRSTKLEVQGPMSMAASFETYSLEDTDEDSILIELCDKPMPITIQVLLVSKIIEEDDALAVVAFQQMHGGDAGQYLVELGCIDLSTYSLAVKCVETIKRFNLQIEQAASILQYCLSQNMNIEDALKVELVSSESC